MLVSARFLLLLTLVLVGTIHAVAPSLEPIVTLEKRAQAWVRALNERAPFRIGKADLSLTIDDPEIYSPEILTAKLAAWRSETSSEILTVLDGGGEYPSRAPRGLADALGELHALYQRAQRWSMYLARRGELTARAADDVRGYHRLVKNRDLEEKLRGFATLEGNEKSGLRENLRGMCLNKFRQTRLCGPAFDARIEKDAAAVYAELLPAARAVWDARFAIPKANRRGDMKILNENGLTVFELPFRDPENEAIWNFVQENVEHAWRGPGWRLRLKKIPVKEIGYIFGKPAYIEFKPNAVASVANGHRITLDANEALTDPNAIRTIQHEFGHVLGFPDCYLEFFDVSAGAIVNYQLDARNIMCSKKGNVSRLHFDKLIEAYGR